MDMKFTSIQSCFDTDRKYYSSHRKVWTTEERNFNLDFCHIFLKAPYFDIAAVETKKRKE